VLRIILPSISRREKTIIVNGHNFRYLRDVLRVFVGDEVIVLDGKGLSFRTNIIDIRKDRILLDVVEMLPAIDEPPP
jgi:16S rRNA U1498 N3-methylase RsmE